jgi:hypothetical protein
MMKFAVYQVSDTELAGTECIVKWSGKLREAGLSDCEYQQCNRELLQPSIFKILSDKSSKKVSLQPPQLHLNAPNKTAQLSSFPFGNSAPLCLQLADLEICPIRRPSLKMAFSLLADMIRLILFIVNRYLSVL